MKPVVHIGWSIFPQRFRYINGSKHPPILMGITGNRFHFGRGGVLVVGPLMLWWITKYTNSIGVQ